MDAIAPIYLYFLFYSSEITYISHTILIILIKLAAIIKTVNKEEALKN